MKRRAVVLVRVVSVSTPVPERDEFGGVDGFVVVKRAIAEIMGAQNERAGDCQQQRSSWQQGTHEFQSFSSFART